jgi:hypothetical protein
MAVVAAGCGPASSSPPGTGAAKAAERYFSALVGRDWPAVYACLDEAAKVKLSADQFQSKAAAFRSDWGFEPEAVQVRSCDEHGDEAVAHVVLSGKGKDGHKQWKDAVALRRGPAGWHVVPPANFGKPRARH